MKKVGIITVHCADNFGAMLQTFALKAYIESLGYDTKVINYCPQRITKEYPVLFYKGEIRDGFRSGLKCLWRSVIYIKFKNLPNMIRKKIKMKRFRDKYLNLTRKSKNERALHRIEKFDVYVTGSDQLWNPDITGLDNAYFLDFAPKQSKKISYAVSVGRLLEEPEKKEIVRKAEGLDVIGLREKQTIEEMKDIIQKKVYETMDPTFLIPRKKWEDIAQQPNKKGKYILFYSIFYTKEQFDAVNYLSKLLGIEVKHYFFGRLAKRLWHRGESFYYAGIEEFLGLVQEAEYIITDSFHGVAFSIIFEKKFAAVLPPKRSIRLDNILEQMELKHRVLDCTPENFDWQWDNLKEDFERINLDEKLYSSKEYIKRELM